jgi:AraC family transcriptional regulator of adaptative response/methylated-DNA-[protein]-cysteine methyltransferase
MEVSDTLNYERIATAIDYIHSHFREQPSLEEIAGHVAVSPFHFQRLFTEWAGTSPKKFLQYISVEHAKKILQESKATLFDAAESTGLSGTSRLHHLFVTIEGMTPAAYKTGGASLAIRYSFAQSPFGKLIIASTEKGICHMAFCEEEEVGFSVLQKKFPYADFLAQTDAHQLNALHIFNDDWSRMDRIKLHLKGTPFQLKVWQTLLSIPSGRLATYGDIARHTGFAGASRAVGTAIGSNPIAFLIPCHRVIQAKGTLGNYMWGQTRKAAIIGWEQSKVL